jgi:hypothetical protein
VTAVLAGLFLAVGDSSARTLPPPLRVHVSFEAAWQAMRDTLNARQLPIEREDRGRGGMLTLFYDYSTGPLTDSRISRVGERPKLSDAEWVRVKYRFAVEVLLVKPRETLVVVDAEIRALKRDFLGAEAWVTIESNGRLEEDLLEEFGKNMFGQDFQLSAPKKGFWEREPKYVPDGEERIPRVAVPDRPTP